MLLNTNDLCVIFVFIYMLLILFASISVFELLQFGYSVSVFGIEMVKWYFTWRFSQIQYNYCVYVSHNSSVYTANTRGHSRDTSETKYISRKLNSIECRLGYGHGKAHQSEIAAGQFQFERDSQHKFQLQIQIRHCIYKMSTK